MNQSNTSPRMAVFIMPTDPDGEDFIPCIAVEGESGYSRTNWNWGKDRQLAERLADESNARRGIAPDEAARIVLLSMR